MSEEHRPGEGPLGLHLAALYRLHFNDVRRERAFLASVSFFFTFAAVRIIVHSIRAGRGPFRNVMPGGRHIHHLVFGITLLLLVGYCWLIEVGTGAGDRRSWMRTTALLYGAGSALTLDEFALWLNLADDYFTPQGRASVDAVILFGAALSSLTWGGPFFRAVARLILGRA
ncbi:MAG: hypothetical protein ACRDFS_11235 [Chloroflexota bacterium]